MKITAIGTFTDEQVIDFATNELGYKPKITQQKKVIDQEATEDTQEYSHFEEELVDNPVSMEEDITEAFKQHVYSFFNTYQARKEKEAVAEIEATIEATKQAAREQIEALKERSIEISVE